MYGPYNLLDKIKRYFRFSKREVLWLAISILAMGFIVGFDDGTQTFVFANWIKNLISSTIIVALAVIVSQTAQKIHGLAIGFKVEYKPFPVGLLIGVMIAFLTFGKFWFLAYGGIALSLMEIHRLGYFRYGLNYWANGWISLTGPLANLALAVFFKLMLFLPNTPLIQKAIMVNVMLAIFGMLPLPLLNGFGVFFASRFLYAFSYGAIIGMGILLIYPFSILFAIIGAILSGIFFTVAYYNFVENTAM